MDEDVTEACVAQGIGVSVPASIVYDPIRGKRLGMIDVSALFEPRVTHVIIRRSMVRHKHITDFVEAFSPHWSKKGIVAEAARALPLK